MRPDLSGALFYKFFVLQRQRQISQKKRERKAEKGAQKKEKKE